LGSGFDLSGYHRSGEARGDAGYFWTGALGLKFVDGESKVLDTSLPWAYKGVLGADNIDEDA